MDEKLSKRFEYMDGLRGVMALNVVICHFVVVFYPEMYFEKFKTSGSWGGVIGYTPLSVLVNGNIAVQYFFLLSGFLTSCKLLLNSEIKMRNVPKMIINRYLRMFPMVLLATIITYLCMKMNVFYHLEVCRYVRNSDFLHNYCNFHPTVISLLNNVFIKSFTVGNDYVGPFWTIPHELKGYILTILICIVFRNKGYRRIVYTVIAIASYPINPNLFSFVLGIFLADLYVVRIYRPEKETNFSKYYTSILYNYKFKRILFLIGGYLACIPMYYVGIYKWLENIPYLKTNVYRAIGLSVIFFIILDSEKIQKILSADILLKLGSISFIIYSIHWPLMLSLQDGVFLTFISKYNYNFSAVFSFVLTLIVIMILSMIISKYYERKFVLKLK